MKREAKARVGMLVSLLLIAGIVAGLLPTQAFAQPEAGTVIASFPSPGPSPTGLAWDGSFLWVCDWGSDTIYKINPSDGSVISSFESPEPSPTGLTWDGTYLWCVDQGNDTIYKINPSDGSVITSFRSPRYWPTGLTSNGSYLWVGNAGGIVNGQQYDIKICKINPSTGSLISSFDSPGPYPTGLAWDGSYLWICDWESIKIYKIDPFNGSIISSFDPPHIGPNGLAWDGTYLWNADNLEQAIYKIDVGPTTEDNPPTIEITSPSDGETISGTVRFSTYATDDYGLEKVEFYIDDELKVTHGPFGPDTVGSTCNWDCDTTPGSIDYIPNGSHTFKAKAYDTAGQTNLDTISFIVHNIARTEVDVDTKYWEDGSYDLRITAQAAPYDVASIRISGPHIDTATVETGGGDPHYLYDDGKHHDGAANDGIWWVLLSIKEPPVVGETITFYITYSDGSSETKQKSIDGVLSETAQLLSPSDGSTVNTLTPTFEWSNPSISGLTYSVQVNDASRRIYDVYDLPDGTTSHTIPSGYLSWGTEYYWLVSASDANGNEALTNWDTFTTQQLTLLEKYAPVLYLHEGEQFYPWGIYSMLDKSNLDNISNPRPGDLESHNSKKYYLDMRDAKPDHLVYPVIGQPHVTWDIPNPERWNGYPFKIYGRQTGIVLQYWFFYPYNSWVNHHEGDWEMIVIILGTQTKTPRWLTCSHHWGGTQYIWDQEVSKINETHPNPKIFIGQGSHSNWASNGTHKVMKILPDVTSETGTALYPEGVNASSIQGPISKFQYTLVDISTEPTWVKWKGRWGEPGIANIKGSSGPESPGYRESNDINMWENPIAWSLDPSPWWYGAFTTSPVNLHAYDSYGNHVGLTETGEVEANIPGTYLYLPSAEGSETMVILTSENIRFEIEATDKGEFDFKFSKNYEEKEKELLVTYENVQITENTVATVDVSPENPGFVMEIDLNGDGTVDETKDPDVIEGAPSVPTGAIIINNGNEYTGSREVTLTLSAENAVEMCFSNDNSSWSDWENYATSRSWTLTSGDGKKTVYVKFRNAIGAQSDVYSDDILLDTTPPTASITSPTANVAVRGSVVIKGTASDENFKQYKVEYGKGTEPSSWTEITTSTSQVTHDTLATWDTSSLNDASYTIRLTSMDLAGHSAQTQVSLRVDNHPPEATLIDYPSETVTGNTPKVAVTFTWTGSDPDGITPVEKLVYQYKLEGHLDYQDWSDWTSETTKIYMFPSGNYTFKVRAKDEAGNYPEEDDSATAKSSFTVTLPIIIYPNPCYPNQGQIVTIANLPLTSNLKIYIYDLGGNLVRTLGESETTIEGGSKTAVWDCRNDNGEVVSRGIYVYFIPSATEKKTGKIAIIK